MNDSAASPLGLLTFLTFGFSIIAAVLAIDMYKLLRTGGFERTWRLLIIASVMFVLLQVLRMAEVLHFNPVAESQLAQVVELCFVLTLAYAFYNQRNIFTRARRRLQNDRANSGQLETEENEEDDDWELDLIDEEEEIEFGEQPVHSQVHSNSDHASR